MTTAQRVIKYFAYGLAAIIVFAIVGGITAAGVGILTAVGIISSGAPEAVVDCSQYEKCLSLQLSHSELYIKKGGSEIMIEPSDNDYEVVRNDTNVVIKDTKKSGWFGNNNRKLTVTVPENIKFESVGISSGAGRIDVESIATKELKMSLGAGETIIHNIEATEKVKISSGAGKLAVEDGVMKDADINLGVGETSIRAEIIGDSKINAGIGSVKLDLLLSESAYTIKADKGIGEIRFNGSSVSDDSTIGNGENKINVDGGIGEINIKTATEKKETEDKAEDKTKEKKELEE